LAQKLHIHHNTLHYKMKATGLHTQFFSLSDQNLEDLVKVFREQQPESGLCYFMGFLHRHGLKVQRQHI
ncbi:hypothetical protein L208DRAFT_1339081, partial [Tricholoma matsutake]